MKEFLLDLKPGNFELFGFIHISMILSVVIAFILIYKNQEKIQNIKPSIQRKIELSFFSILFSNMFIYYTSRIIYGAYDWKVHLPFHFCFIAGFTFMYILLKQKKELFKIIYFFAFIGPIPAIIWTDLNSTFDAFIFYQMYISHHVFLAFTLFIFYMYDMYITKKDLYKSFIIAISIFILMAIFNVTFKTNYIMSDSLPEFLTIKYPFLEHFDKPFLLFLPMTMIVFGFAYIFPHLKNKRQPLQ